MVGHWVAERRFYQPRPVPKFEQQRPNSATSPISPRSSGARTQEVGCAEASNRTDEYVVCRYLPAGNVLGEMAY